MTFASRKALERCVYLLVFICMCVFFVYNVNTLIFRGKGEDYLATMTFASRKALERCVCLLVYTCELFFTNANVLEGLRGEYVCTCVYVHVNMFAYYMY